jgi:hypothetical protein
MGVCQSMGRVGSALDNAAAEAVNFTIKVVLVHRIRFSTRAQARAVIGTWISGFYNTRRRHSACRGLSPIAYEYLIMNMADQEDQAAWRTSPRPDGDWQAPGPLLTGSPSFWRSFPEGLAPRWC